MRVSRDTPHFLHDGLDLYRRRRRASPARVRIASRVQKPAPITSALAAPAPVARRNAASGSSGLSPSVHAQRKAATKESPEATALAKGIGGGVACQVCSAVTSNAPSAPSVIATTAIPRL